MQIACTIQSYVCLNTWEMCFGNTKPATRFTVTGIFAEAEEMGLLFRSQSAKVKQCGLELKKKKRYGCVAGLSKNSFPCWERWVSGFHSQYPQLLNVLARSFSVPTINRKMLIYIQQLNQNLKYPLKFSDSNSKLKTYCKHFVMNVFRTVQTWAHFLYRNQFFCCYLPEIQSL